jgi:hypothetical protein
VPQPQGQEPQDNAPKAQPTPEPKPNPNVEAPAFVWVNKGYDPRKPNPGRVGEPKKSPSEGK